MGKLTSWLKISFHISKLGISMLTAYMSFKWSVRKATGTFKETLLSEGLSEDIANKLAESYEQSNRKMLRLVDTGLASFSKKSHGKDGGA